MRLGLPTEAGLLGQKQFVLFGDAQAVVCPFVPDRNFGCVAEECQAGNARLAGVLEALSRLSALLRNPEKRDAQYRVALFHDEFLKRVDYIRVA